MPVNSPLDVVQRSDGGLRSGERGQNCHDSGVDRPYVLVKVSIGIAFLKRNRRAIPAERRNMASRDK